ncbi:MAG: phosphomannomutase/phosphoglucomutase [Sarcina sp.]
MDLLKGLQNGTDIRGRAIEYKDLKSNLTEETVSKIANGFSNFLRDRGFENIKVAVGMDSRLSGEKLKTAIIESLLENNIEVFDCNLATTPAMFTSTIIDEYNCDGAIMITASHLPYYYNGMKFFTKEGGLEKEDIREIIEKAERREKIEKRGKVIKANLLNSYSEILVKIIKERTGSEKPLDGLKIIVDAGNGSGGFFAEKVLIALGADTKGSQFLNPDGTFPNHIPNPEDSTAMESIRKAVLDSKADLGIIFDTDVDRAAIVDKWGKEINKNALIALISAIILEEHPKSTIVTDSITSDGLREFIENLGGNHHRFKRGYKNVINESKRLNNMGIESDLAIETSGHAAIKENYFLDDGAYLIAKILIKMAKMNKENKYLTDLIANLAYPKESKSYRLNIDRVDFKEYGERILKDLNSFVEKNNSLELVKENYEGVKVLTKDNKGWFLMRLSLHEPLIAINIETGKENTIEEVIKLIKNFLNQYKAINLENLK